MNACWVAVLLTLVTSRAAEEINPYRDVGDETQECYAWAADGQCQLNPGHMLSNCKYSCWEWYRHRRETYPTAPIDKSMDCYGWSTQGECRKNPEYMKKTCPERCQSEGRKAGASKDEA